MGCHTYRETNDRIAKLKEQINELIDWADADAEHASGSGASDTAKDDRVRAKMLRNALNLVADCERVE